MARFYVLLLWLQ